MVPFSTTVVDLGVTVDSQLSMTDHISSLCRSCFYQLRQLRVIRHSLTTDAARTLVQAFITSRLDYCNSLLYGIADCQLRRLQCIQNAAARLLSGTRKFDHVSPVLRDLHWLPVRKRIFFKVATLMFKCLHGLAPSYLPHRILHTSVNYRRSTSSAVCDHPAGIRAILSDYICSRSFAVSGSTVWNNLRPPSLLEILEKIICPGILDMSWNLHIFQVLSCKSNKNTGSALTANVDSTSLITFEKKLSFEGRRKLHSKLFAEFMLKVS